MALGGFGVLFPHDSHGDLDHLVDKLNSQERSRSIFLKFKICSDSVKHVKKEEEVFITQLTIERTHIENLLID